MQRTQQYTRVFILCAGDGSRWNNYLGIPKQLIQFNCESLLARAARMLGEEGIDDFICVSNDRRLQLPGIVHFHPEKHNCLAETILATRHLWTSRTIFLLGDVYFTRRSVNSISRYRGELGVFGRPWASKLIDCTHGELFAMSFSAEAAAFVTRAAEEVARLVVHGARGNLWDVYHTLSDLPLNSGRAESRIFQIVDDITNDFDRPSDYILRGSTYEAFASSRTLEKVFYAARLAGRYPAHILARRPVAISALRRI